MPYFNSNEQNSNFDELASKLISDAAAAATDKDFYRAISAFLNAFGDAHVSYEIPSSLEACLPFNTEYFKDGVVITGVNYNVLCQMGGKGHCDDEIPVEEGDLLIAIDGIPVEDVIASLVVFENNGHEETSRKFTGSVRLACRPQYIFPDIPSGASVITIITKDGTKKDVALEWISKGFELAEIDLKLRGPGEVFGTKQHGFPELKIARWDDIELIKEAKKVAETNYCQLIGLKIQLPKYGTTSKKEAHQKQEQ